MGWKDRIKSIQTKMKNIKTKTNKIIGTEKMKETKARAKTEVQKAQKLTDDLKKATKRLGELKSQDAIEKKRNEIASLERRLTTKGKILTGLESLLKTGIKMAKEKHNRSIRPRKPRRKRRRGR
jgi:glutamine synthetase adenylyltransferase